MSSRTSVLTEAMLLPRSERAEIARELIASLDVPDDDDVEAAWLLEAERRLQDVEQGVTQPALWEAARERIAARLRTMRR